jgi:hypothetical protein
MLICAQSQISFLTVDELVALTHCDSFAMLIRGYIDDSADEKHKTVAVAGAFLGNHKQWKKLVREWRARLRGEGIRYFRSTEYYSLRGEFERYRDPVKYPKPKGSEAAKSFRDDLESIIKESGIRGFAHCIPLEMYQEVRDSVAMAADVFPTDAFEVALQSLIRDCAKEFKQLYGDRHKLAFMCDEGPSSARIGEAYRAFKALNPDFSDMIGTLIFGDDKRFPQLQAADMMASTGKEIRLRIQGGNEAPIEHRLSSSIYFVRHWTKDIMLQLLDLQLRHLHERGTSL